MALSLSCLIEMLDCLPKNLYVITTMLGEIITTEVRPLGESVLIQTLFSAMYTKLIEAADRDAASNVATTALSKSSICMILAEAICSIDEDNKHTEAINNLVLRSQHFAHTDDDVLEDDSLDELEASAATVQSGSDAGQSHGDDEYNIDANACMSELICGDLLATSVGKQSAKLLYSYLKFNGEWLMQQLKISTIELSEYKLLPGQNVKENKLALLESMFHIGQQPFDQVSKLMRIRNCIAFDRAC